MVRWHCFCLSGHCIRSSRFYCLPVTLILTLLPCFTLCPLQFWGSLCVWLHGSFFLPFIFWALIFACYFVNFLLETLHRSPMVVFPCVRREHHTAGRLRAAPLFPAGPGWSQSCRLGIVRPLARSLAFLCVKGSNNNIYFRKLWNLNNMS